MEAKLVVVSGKAPSDEYVLQLPTIIGRSRSVNLPIGHPLISRQHCEIYEDDGVLKVRDLGSLNGTYVDDLRLADEPVTLPSGRRLTIGAVTFKAVYEMAGDSALDDLPDFSDNVEHDAGTKIAEKTVRADEDDEKASQTPQVRAAKPAPAVEEDDEADLSPPGGARDQDFDLGWLDDEPEAGGGANDVETNEAGSNETVQLPANSKSKAKAPEPKPAKPAAKGFFGKSKDTKPPAKTPAKPAEETIAFEPSNDTEGGGSHKFAPPNKAASAGGEEDEENLDDFFKNLQ